MSTTRFAVERVEPMQFRSTAIPASSELMSPYVWQDGPGSCCAMVRVVPAAGGADASTGSIWFGRSRDGLVFDGDDAPVLSPDPGGPDAGGCEDPTVIQHDGGLVVFYTGVDDDGDGHLLWASGPDAQSLTKHGVALTSFSGEQDIKEAEISVRDGHWTMGYEYAHDGASLIGYAEGDGPTGPWRETKHGFGPRADRFDCWHLSPGPMLLDDPDHPVMFYNGADRDGVWGIGWVVFDHPNNRVLDRCEQPLIAPPGEEGGRNMAFAASVIDRGDWLHLYFSRNDRSCHRATVRCGNGERGTAG